MPLPVILAAVGRGAAVAGRAAAASGEAGAASKLSNIAGQFGQISYAAQSAGGALHQLASGLIPLAPHVQLAVAGLNLFKDTVAGIGSAVAPFVKLASPVHIKLFELAVDDLTASIGKFLIPVMEYGTALVRKFADVTFALSDPLQRLMTAIFKPLIKLLDSSHMDVFIDALAIIIDLMAEAADVFGDMIISLTKFLGVGGTSKFKDSSVGAAVRPAQITSVEEYGRKAQQAAFSLGSAATPADRTATATERLVALFENLPGNLAMAIAKIIVDNPTAKAVKEGVERGAEVTKRVARRGARFGAFGIAGIAADAILD